MRKALITGASKGIGKAIALEIFQDGFDITLHYGKDKNSAQELCDFITRNGGIANLLSFDISNRNETRDVLENHINKHGAYWAIVCNAGIAIDNAFPSMEPDQWDDVLRTNLDGFYNVLHPSIMPMVRLKEGGRIITLSSVAGIAGNRGQVNYSASKAGVIGATKALAIELAKRNITVNCIAPGLIETQMTDTAPINEMINYIPMRRLGKAVDVAALAKFLLSDKASYITRQVISVNGGLI